MTLFKWVLVLLLLSESIGQVWAIANRPARPTPTMRWTYAIAMALLAFWALAVIP